MFVCTISFYFFSIIAVLSALMVISAKNPVHSVLFLILSFVNTSALFVLLGAEFLAMILIVVYVGMRFEGILTLIELKNYEYCYV